jgi:uncharacterized protein (DUF885 family)
MKQLQKLIIITAFILLSSVWIAGCRSAQTTELPPTLPTDLPAETVTLPPEITLEETSEVEPANTLAGMLEGLTLDEFFEVSYRELLLRDPEVILEVGLTDVYGVEEVELTNISDAYIRETQQMHTTILEMLRVYDRSALTPEQQVSYDVYEWYLDDLVRGQEFMYYNYPSTQFITAVHSAVSYFFSDIHPITSKQDGEDYITRLWLVKDKFDQLLEGLRIREEIGVIPPKYIVSWVKNDVSRTARSNPLNTSFYTAFADKLDLLEGLSPSEKQALLEGAEDAIRESVIPAYQALADYLEHLESVATTDEGVWKFPNGEQYYKLFLRHYTTTEMTADEIHQLGLSELDRIHAEMRELFDELGYQQDGSLPDLYARVAKEGGYVSGNQVLSTYESIIQQADINSDAAFDIRPKAEVVVIGDDIGGFYQSGSIDGSRPGAFYANISGGEDVFGMPTLAYHEAIPGHHFQISIALELTLASFRRGVTFTSYVEGWALYAEHLAWELGWYEDDPYGNLGRLQGEAFRAARLVVDTGIHADGWTFDKAVDFMVENTGQDRGFMEWEVSRYIVWPGQAVSYKIGMLKILELRRLTEAQLGDRYDIKEFHNVVLTNGSMPLDVLSRVVNDYIETKLNQ